MRSLLGDNPERVVTVSGRYNNDGTVGAGSHPAFIAATVSPTGTFALRVRGFRALRSATASVVDGFQGFISPYITGPGTISVYVASTSNAAVNNPFNIVVTGIPL
jgi:hypothetical protein